MNARIALVLAVVACVAMGCAAGRKNIQSTAESYNGANFNGEWKLEVAGDADKVPQDPLWLLPSTFKIASTSQALQLLDGTGTLIAEIALDSNYPYAASPAYTTDVDNRPRARWVGPRTFAYERTVPDSFQVTRTFGLDSEGRQLEVALSVSGQAGKRSITRVYRRI